MKEKSLYRVAGQKLDAFVKPLLPTDPWIWICIYVYIYIQTGKNEKISNRWLIFFSFRPIDLFFNICRCIALASRVRFETLIVEKYPTFRRDLESETRGGGGKGEISSSSSYSLWRISSGAERKRDRECYRGETRRNKIHRNFNCKQPVSSKIFLV